MKKLIALILALALAAGLVPALADEEAAVETAAAETEAAAVAERKLLATVNGEEIWNDNRNIAQLKNYYLNYFAQYYGLDVYEDAAPARGDGAQPNRGVLSFCTRKNGAYKQTGSYEKILHDCLCVEWKPES